jgi:hypothetical protein
LKTLVLEMGVELETNTLPRTPKLPRFAVHHRTLEFNAALKITVGRFDCDGLSHIEQNQLISRLCLCLLNYPSGKLQNRMCRQAQGQAPRQHYPAKFANPFLPIEVHNIDREPHAARMD